MGRLDGKVAAVTGGASGIGEATVRRFVAEGAQVAFCDRDGERGQRVAAELAAAGAKVAFTQVDVGTEAACLAFVNGAAEKFGRLDILVNNAGITRDQLLLRMKRQDWDEVLATNLTPVFALSQAVLKPMVKQRGGRIVTISSVVALMGNAGQANYAASKAGIIGLSRSLAREGEIGRAHV